MREQNLYCQSVQISSPDLFEVEARRIAHDPEIQAVRFALALHRAKAARKPPPITYRPPPLRRCQCRPPRRTASSNDGEASDAR
jgi:hypothetical protein